jgi:Chemotaxis response regulator containing a CheY-like receiver domain and a methylesterase domain
MSSGGSGAPAARRLDRRRPGGDIPEPPASRQRSSRRAAGAPLPPELIVIGCSLGGLHALRVILSSLSREFCIPIAVAMHRHPKSNEELPAFFRRETDLVVVDAEDKQWIAAGHVYLAPADYHLLIERNGARGELSLSVDEKVHYSRPSIDVLFESAADAYRDRLLGIVLTGANDDGARGAARIKARGGIVVVQDPTTAEAPAMPRAAIEASAVDRILRLEEIGPFLIEVCQTSVSRS